MPLSDDTIKATLQRYKREYDCYDKLCRFVAAKCERDIIRANAIRAAVTARAKAPAKFADKLKKKYRGEEALNTVDEALARVTDLAGVRISTYLEIDRDTVVEEIKKRFDGPNGNEVHVDVKEGGFYRATHCQVALKPEDLVAPFDNLEGLTCEIQVCSLLAHVWNELEHDLAYKPTTGDLSDREKESLDILGNLTLSGDKVIKQLFDANAERIKQAQNDLTPFQDVHDFVVRMRDEFPNQPDFGKNAGQLFEDLAALGLDTPPKVKEHLLTEGFAERSDQTIAQLIAYLQEHDEDTVEVDPRSSDALLVLLLDVHLNEVLERHPMGRGRGRPPRIASFAKVFKQMREPQQRPAEPPPLANGHNDQAPPANNPEIAA